MGKEVGFVHLYNCRPVWEEQFCSQCLRRGDVRSFCRADSRLISKHWQWRAWNSKEHESHGSLCVSDGICLQFHVRFTALASQP